MNPHDVTKSFEADLCAYTGAPHAVVVNSCTMALLLSCACIRQSLTYRPVFSIPKHTYVGVAMSVVNAGCGLTFRDEEWSGEYELQEHPQTGPKITDAARRFTSGMFGDSSQPRFQCVSFHVSKICGHSQGGAILHNVPEADQFLRRARFDGRREGVAPKDDRFDMLGYHCYMSVDVAAALRWKLSALPKVNADLPWDDYPDLSLQPIFGGQSREDIAA